MHCTPFRKWVLSYRSKKTNNPNPSPIGKRFGLYGFGARGGSRTRTPLRALAPEASESTNSTTRAFHFCTAAWYDAYITTANGSCQHLFSSRLSILLYLTNNRLCIIIQPVFKDSRCESVSPAENAADTLSMRCFRVDTKAAFFL